jgi:hypothetical protein
MSVGLIVIDIQNDYFPNGKMEFEDSEQAGQVAERSLGFFRERRSYCADLCRQWAMDRPMAYAPEIKGHLTQLMSVPGGR